MVIYRAVRLLLGAAVRVFFRDVQIVGLRYVPAEGASSVVFAGNHPNSLIDPVLLCTTSGRIVHFAAKDKLFRFPMSLVLAALGAVPIARRMDYAEGAARRDNADALASLTGVLTGGRAVGIFPEGLSHNEAHLQQLRTGAARIALDAAARGEPVQVVCCGLHYVRRRRFRSRVRVQYGPPIDVDETWVARWRDDGRAAAAALTSRIEASLHDLTVNAADWETLRVLDGVRRLYQPPRISLHDRVVLAHRFSSVYPTVQHEPAVRALYERVERYLDRLDEVGLTDRDLARGMDRWALLGRGLRNLATLLVWAPLALPGLPVHLPLLWAIGWMGRRFAPRKDVIGTSRLVVGMLAVGLAYVGLPVATWALAGPLAALAVALLLPLTGYATLRVLERGVSLRRLFTSALASFRLGYEHKALALWRDELEAEVVAAVQRFIPDDMEPLFPRA